MGRTVRVISPLCPSCVRNRGKQRTPGRGKTVKTRKNQSAGEHRRENGVVSFVPKQAEINNLNNSINCCCVCIGWTDGRVYMLETYAEVCLSVSVSLPLSLPLSFCFSLPPSLHPRHFVPSCTYINSSAPVRTHSPPTTWPYRRPLRTPCGTAHRPPGANRTSTRAGWGAVAS